MMHVTFTVEGLQNMTYEEMSKLVLEQAAKIAELQSTVDSSMAKIDQQSIDMVNMSRSYSEMKAELDARDAKIARLEKELETAKSTNAVYARMLFTHGTESVSGIIGQNGQKADSTKPVNPSDDQDQGQGAPEQGSNNGKDDTQDEKGNGSGNNKGGKRPSGEDHPDGSQDKNGNGSGNGNKNPGNPGSKNNLIRVAMKNLPQRDEYIFSLDTIEMLDAKYGPGNWRVSMWELTSHLEVIPQLMYTQNDYRPVIEYREAGTTGLWRPECPYFYPHSIYSPSLVSSIICDKYAMGLPIYRQMGAMERLIGDSPERGNVSKMLIRAAKGCFMPVYEYMRQTFLTLSYSQSDETPLQVIEGGATKVHYLWCHTTGELRPDDPQITFFEFEKTRSAEHLRKLFSNDFVRTITTDCYICYSTIENEVENITVTNCWGHVRRRFYYAFCVLADVADVSDDVLKTTEEYQLLDLIGKIFDADTRVKYSDPDFRLEARQTVIKPMVDTFFETLKGIDLDNPNLTDKMVDAVSYALNHEEHLRRFLDDPSVPIDNNNCERSIRQVAVGRRNWLFADTFNGAIALAVYYTLVATALKNNADPFFYIKYLCERMPGGIDGPARNTKLTEEFLKSLMPWSPEYRAYEAEERARFFSVVSLASGKKPDIAAMRNAAKSAA